ncbi:MAG: VC0807 family protein [Nakamurella sp.]
MTNPTPARKRRRGWLMLDFAVPFALYYLLHWLGVGDVAALSAGAAVSVLSTLISVLRTRKVDLLSLITLLAMVLGLVVALISGNARQLLVRSAWISAPIGFWTLASLRSERPLSYVFTRALLRPKAALMEQLWASEALFRLAWRNVTILCGTASVLDAALQVGMAYTLPIASVPALDTALNVATAVLLQVPTHLLIRRSGSWNALFSRRHQRSVRLP